MKQLEIGKSAVCPHFIGSWLIEPVTLCDSLIALYHNNDTKHKPGTVGYGRINSDFKRTMDLTISPADGKFSDNEAIMNYFDLLYECYRDYLATWPYLKKICKKVDIGSFNIQKYESGDHFKEPHSERTEFNDSFRVLAWMTYLNDVKDGGETVFTHYDLEVKPEKGKTLIWPADWTHAHYGSLVASGPKYIITGWMDFPVD